MTRTCIRVELPKKYNERERKRGRSRTATYREENGDWVLVVDRNLIGEKKK